MIGYTGPIRCLRLYRTVILPPYSARARYPYLRSILFLQHVNVPRPVKARKSCRNESLPRVSENVCEFDIDGKL